MKTLLAGLAAWLLNCGRDNKPPIMNVAPYSVPAPQTSICKAPFQLTCRESRFFTLCGCCRPGDKACEAKLDAPKPP